MHRPADTRSLFADAIEIPAWLERDHEMHYAERLRRDRAIGATLAMTDPLQCVRAWWRQLPQPTAHDTPEHSLVMRLERGRRLVALLMAFAGAVGGAAVAAAAFYYDGTWPVNILTALAMLVLLQLLLVMLTLLLMLPRLPGLRTIQELLSSLNPGAMVAGVYRRIRPASDAETLLRLHRTRGPDAARFTRWQVLAWSQLAAVAFNVAALATAGGLIAFTDLAFGWSTTLQMGNADVLRITDTLSAPWRNLWPEAVPGLQLIEASRFFRLAGAQPTAIPAASLTLWWPFLMASIFTYGFLPRCALLALSLFRLHAATVHLLTGDSRVRALLERLHSSNVTLGPAVPEAPLDPVSLSTASTVRPDPSHQAAAAIVWSNALPAASAQQWASEHLQQHVAQVREAGGGRSPSADATLVEQLVQERPSRVLVLVRAWEPPLLDLQDFIELLRSRLGSACSLILVPVGLAGAAATDTQRAMWSRWRRHIADPGLYVETALER